MVLSFFVQLTEPAFVYFLSVMFFLGRFLFFSSVFLVTFFLVLNIFCCGFFLRTSKKKPVGGRLLI